ncbi:MAG TPA: hypothetical protein RMH99_06635 [Sandaracinaceae bacterium LLY-WYZ-13_1]|nr:hypothetical protein [Sandaracinaceae bacterium LLY-WYZ-13_1]
MRTLRRALLVGLAIAVVGALIAAVPASRAWTIGMAEDRTGLTLDDAETSGWSSAHDVFRATVRGRVASVAPERWPAADADTLARLAERTDDDAPLPRGEGLRAAGGPGWYAVFDPATDAIRVELCAPLTEDETVECP